MTPTPHHPDTPSPTLRVIGAGFGRTGTLSLREALVRLGYGPCDHMLENFEHPSRFGLWDEALARKRAGKPIDWRSLLGGYRAIVDWPGAYFWRELIAAHPDAKVILTVRDPDRWYESCLRTIYRARGRVDASAGLGTLLALLAQTVPPLRRAFHVVNGAIWEGTFGGRFHDRDHALRIFAEHLQEVQAAVPPERLLVFDVKEGWEPLCAFLDVPVPTGEPFPHVNDAASFQRRIRQRVAQTALRLARPVVLAAAGIAALTWIKGRVGKSGSRKSKVDRPIADS
jgi:hypothetical protein